MFFEYPMLLWLLAVPALLILHYVYLEVKERKPHLRVSTVTPWTIRSHSALNVLRHLPFALRIAALSLIVVAIARPRSSTKVERIDTEGIDIVLSMDVSTSMLAAILRRTGSARRRISRSSSFPNGPPTGWESWSSPGKAIRKCPLTTDRATLINLMKEISTDLIEDGTAIGNGWLRPWPG